MIGDNKLNLLIWLLFLIIGSYAYSPARYCAPGTRRVVYPGGNTACWSIYNTRIQMKGKCKPIKGEEVTIKSLPHLYTFQDLAREACKEDCPKQRFCFKSHVYDDTFPYSYANYENVPKYLELLKLYGTVEFAQPIRSHNVLHLHLVDRIEKQTVKFLDSGNNVLITFTVVAHPLTTEVNVETNSNVKHKLKFDRKNVVAFILRFRDSAFYIDTTVPQPAEEKYIGYNSKNAIKKIKIDQKTTVTYIDHFSDDCEKENLISKINKIKRENFMSIPDKKFLWQVATSRFDQYQPYMNFRTSTARKVSWNGLDAFRAIMMVDTHIHPNFIWKYAGITIECSASDQRLKHKCSFSDAANKRQEKHFFLRSMAYYTNLARFGYIIEISDWNELANDYNLKIMSADEIVYIADRVKIDRYKLTEMHLFSPASYADTCLWVHFSQIPQSKGYEFNTCYYSALSANSYLSEIPYTSCEDISVKVLCETPAISKAQGETPVNKKLVAVKSVATQDLLIYVPILCIALSILLFMGTLALSILTKSRVKKNS